MARILRAVQRRRLTLLGVAVLLLALAAPAAGGGRRAFSRVILAAGSAPVSSAVERFNAPTRPASAHPNLDARLSSLVGKRSPSFTSVGIRPTGVGLSRVDGMVRVLIDARRVTAARAAVSRLGGKVELSRGGVVAALMPTTALSTLSRDPAVRFVSAPSPFVPAQVPGEEVNASGATAWHAKGLTGKGVKVAIVDGGYIGLAERQASGDLPTGIVTTDLCGGHFNDGSEHGTAVAEIVHEMAPDAQLLLACVDTETSMALAEQWAKSQGAQIVNMSGGFYGGRGDGSGISGSAVTDARNNGILWVNAAGNSAQTHWSGTYVDANGDGASEIDPSTGNEGNFFIWPNNETICGYLTWDEWPVAQSDFDLYLYIQAQNGFLPWSRVEQSGSQPPLEANCLLNPTGSDLVVAWVIVGYRVVSSPRLDLFSESPPLQYQIAAGSVSDPATSPAALAVGALCWQSNSLEPYSSQGPTIDGRVKPDIAGHDSVSGATYGAFTSCPSAFAGTSAASPEVAGAAALVKQAHPTWKPKQIQEFLEKSALDLGAPGKDNQYGAGQLRLGALSISDTTAPQAWAVASSGKKGKRIRLLSLVWDDSGVVTVTEQVKRNGRTIATVRSGPARTSTDVAEPERHTTLWKAPAKLKGRITHCVQAKDKAGNKSQVSCAKVKLK